VIARILPAHHVHVIFRELDDDAEYLVVAVFALVDVVHGAAFGKNIPLDAADPRLAIAAAPCCMRERGLVLTLMIDVAR
jgi:hypothetical protein